MKALVFLFLVFVIAIVCGISGAFADTLLLSSGHTASGTVIQTNDDRILLLTRHAVYSFTRTYVKEIRIETKEADQPFDTDRLSNFKRAILVLSKQVWATNIMPIPATVIDKGILSNVPYSSLKCGDNYEVNIYGDLDHPAGIEIGFYKVRDDDKTRQSNCIQFVSDILTQWADRTLIEALDSKKDLKTLDDLTFEITPPTSDDAYNGWWISVYSEKHLNFARASDAEMKDISISNVEAAKESSKGNSSQWSADELKLVRVSVPTTITFTDKDGQVISNASVRIYQPGVSLIWETTNGAAGLVKLADLPQSLQDSFGFDQVKATAADALEKGKKEQWQKNYDAQMAQAALAAQRAQDALPSDGFSGSDGSSSSYSGGGSVYVHGYYRSNGTYVSAYTRRR